MTNTIKELQAQMAFLTERLGKLERTFQPEEKNFFYWQGEKVGLLTGERYVGTIVSADGRRNHHIILLPGAVSKKTWNAAKEWSESIGGELPDRVESALLFATMKDEFEEAWYWTREAYVSGSCSAWGQCFYYGGQGHYGVGGKLRARAIRRLPVFAQEIPQ